MSESLQRLLDNNRNWARSETERDPTYFEKLLKQQTPEILWIGCSDSRVPANQITGLAPGEVFVHRNVGNVVVHTDLNCLTVIDFAVDLLQVKHIIVVGHYGCSGVERALSGSDAGIAGNWLRHIQDVRTKHHVVVDAVADDQDKHALLCELNVIEQAVNVCRTSIVQKAWQQQRPLGVHGWIYSLRDGLLVDLGFSAARDGDIQSSAAAATERAGSRYRASSQGMKSALRLDRVRGSL